MKFKSASLFSISVVCLTTSLVAQAQQANQYNNDKYSPVSLENYVSQIDGTNVNILAKRRIVETVTAQQSPMGTPNVNPSLTISHGSSYSSIPYSGYSAPQSNTLSLSGTYEGWGKLTARKDYYSAELERNNVELEALKNSIKMDAAYAFLDTLRYKLSWNSYQKAITKLKALKATDPVTNLTKDQFNTANDLKYYSFTMTTFLSKGQVGLLEPVGDIDKIVPLSFKLKTLLDSAMDKRGDVLALNQAVKSSQMALELASKNRNISISPSIWASKTPAYLSSGTSYGATVAAGFSVTIPIPTNLMFDADITEASNNLANMQDYLSDLKARISAEVNQAFMQYGYAVDKLNAAKDDFDAASKNSAENIDAVLNMREKEGNLIDAKINHAKALIYLKKVSGDYQLPKI